MPGSRHPRAIVLAALASLPTAAVLSASQAAAAPTPTPTPSKTNNPCDLIVGLARDYCEDGEKAGGARRSGPADPADALDPLASLARGCADAAVWTVDTLSKAVKSTASVDFT
ncbi:MAG TPA: hypothetical protein VFG16_29870, partial [Streptomyces sp.]|nr:hypothetical protein [Streptomyces sp.]